jgi:N-acetylated-alpha-linked acidic dipeptidase
MPVRKSNPMKNSLLKFCALVLLLGVAVPPAEYGVPAGGAPRVPFGFSPESYQAEARWEKTYLALPDAAQCGRFLHALTRYPHVAGTPGDRAVTEMIYDEFKRDGLDAEIVSYNVLLSYPKKIAVELVAPARVKLANPEPPIAGDPDTRPTDPMVAMPWNAYSPSADITRAVVYVNHGNAEDYNRLEKMGVSVKDRIVLARYFQGYRGGKSLEAEKRGAAGIIVYSDPADDGAKKGKVYPDGPWGPLGHFQRGSVVYDFEVPGDPLTPGWASTEGARRIPESESKILPKIPMVPLSGADALEILKRLRGPRAPKHWQGGLPVEYRAGDGSAKVRLDLEMENKVTPIWDVIGKIQGSEEPEKTVILGNHHDAWVYGAVDPASGTATMLETARALGELLKQGFRPRRTLILGSWDAEEYTLTGSTEWGEDHEAELKKNAVVCFNVDSATSGQDFTVSMVPSLERAVSEATEEVRDPATGKTVYERWKEAGEKTNVRSYAVRGSSAAPVPYGMLGGGSDFMVFLQHDGVPSLDMIFDGPYGVYHSLYDDYQWMARYGDPGFRYHAAMSRLWGLLALRFANADIIPLDYSSYPNDVAAYLAELRKSVPGDFARSQIDPLIEKCREWHGAAAKLAARVEARAAPAQSAASASAGGAAGVSQPEPSGLPRVGGVASAPEGEPLPLLRSHTKVSVDEINAVLMSEERALLDPQGIPQRPWFRHLIYAPLPSYDAESLPGLREAIEARDWNLAREQAAALSRALDRATLAAKAVAGGGQTN